MPYKKMLKDWELEKGIEIKEKHKDLLLSEKQYMRMIKSKNIIIKTQKGTEYLATLKR